MRRNMLACGRVSVGLSPRLGKWVVLMERICSEEDSAATGYRHFVVWAVIGLVLSFVAGAIEPTEAG